MIGQHLKETDIKDLFIPNIPQTEDPSAQRPDCLPSANIGLIHLNAFLLVITIIKFFLFCLEF